jgi:hypothetical protein
MSLWFRRVEAMNSDLMRKAASNAGVSWEWQQIRYKLDGIGYFNGDTNDATEIKDELEKLLGYRPVKIDEPTAETNQTDRPQ